MAKNSAARSATAATRSLVQAVPFTAVRFTDAFWAPRQETVRTRAIPANERQCELTGRFRQYDLTWKPGQPDEPHIFWDSDVAKYIEAASFSLASHPDAALEQRLDTLIARIASAQQPDGYLNPHFTVVRPGQRWKHFDDHELYGMGHLIEAGVAHHAATGKRTLLEVCIRIADCIDGVFGPRPGQRHGYCGHEEVELALVALWKATGECRYLAMATHFIDARGTAPHYFDTLRAESPDAYVYKTQRHEGNWSYYQAHLPVREQTEVTGHAVRAVYLYCGMADIAAATGDQGLAKAGRTLWNHTVTKLMYVTGGIGSSRHNEGFTFDHDLPNETAYCETCASVGLIFWAQRLFQQERDSQYIDVLERALYNAAIAGISLDGERFFYENPLASLGQHHRQEWFGCSCCPPNIARLLASLGGYVYATADSSLYVQLYAASTATMTVAGTVVALSQQTAYPWSGAVELTVTPAAVVRFALRLRQPAWCSGASVRLNCKAVKARVEQGYLVIEREWQAGDTVQLDLPMAIERVHADPRVRQDVGRVALSRGPLIFCLEGCDNGADLDAVSLPRGATTTWRLDKKLLGGVGVIRSRGRRALPFSDDATYHTTAPQTAACALTAIPYYAWDHRAPGAMQVWIRETV